jgi:arylsulfatase A-like enzyme
MKNFFSIFCLLVLAKTMLFAQTTKPNVLVLLTEDQNIYTIAALGNKEISTPNLDKLVADGTTFTNAHVNGGLSGAICQPSRAMLLTGRTLFNIDRQARDNQEYSFDVFNNYITFPWHFKNNGYQTVGIGKQHNGTDVYARSFSDGAKVFFGGMSDQYVIPHQDFAPDGKYPKERTYNSTGKHTSEIYADETIKFIEKYKNQPFLIYTAFQTPHDPRQSPKEYQDLYANKDITLPPNFLPNHPFDNGELKVRDELLAPFPRTVEDTKKQLKEYYATVTHLDAQIGRIIASLKANGLYDNTIIVFAGDNGLAVGQHGLFGKQNLYEHSSRVPLIIAGPGVKKNQKATGLCYLTDIYGTLTERVGLPTPPTVQSVSLNKAIENPSTTIRPALYLAFKHFQRSIKKDGFKLIEYHVNKERHTQLFDLSKDPWETQNLAEKPKFATKLKSLRDELLALKTQHNDHFSTFWEGFKF